MKKSKVWIVFMLIFIVSSMGCGTAQKKQEAGQKNKTAESGQESFRPDEKTTVTPPKEVRGKKFDAVILDTGVHTITVQTDGALILDFTLSDEADTSKLEEGLAVGKIVKIAVDGMIHGTDTSTVKVISIEPSIKKINLGEKAAEKAAQVMMAVKKKDLNMLADLAVYPFYYGKGDGEVINSKEEFVKKDKDEVFTEGLKSRVLSENLFETEETQVGIVLGGEKPDIILSQEEGYKITGINE